MWFVLALRTSSHVLSGACVVPLASSSCGSIRRQQQPPKNVLTPRWQQFCPTSNPNTTLTKHEIIKYTETLNYLPVNPSHLTTNNDIRMSSNNSGGPSVLKQKPIAVRQGNIVAARGTVHSGESSTTSLTNCPKLLLMLSERRWDLVVWTKWYI